MAKNIYAVLPDATVFRCKTEREAKDIDGAVIATDKDVSKVPTSVIVKLYNRVRPERPVTKFSDRATAEKRMEGVLDFVAKPNPYAPPPGATKVPKEKKEKAPKEAGKRGAKVKEISPETVDRVIEMKNDGKTWAEICAELGEPHNFLHRVRPLLRAKDPTLVKPLGPGSPNYGKGPQPKAPRVKGEKTVRVKKVRDRGIPVEVF